MIITNEKNSEKKLQFTLNVISLSLVFSCSRKKIVDNNDRRKKYIIK